MIDQITGKKLPEQKKSERYKKYEKEQNGSNFNGWGDEDLGGDELNKDFMFQSTMQNDRIEISRMEKYLTIKSFLNAERGKQVAYATEAVKRKFSYVGGNAKKAREKAEQRIVYLDELLEGWKEDLKISVEKGSDL